jgi:hypothetical protein
LEQEVLDLSRDSQGVGRKSKALESIYTVVGKHLRYDNDAVNRVVAAHNVERDGIISLAEFIRARVGVCRHQAVACVGLIELLNQRNYHAGGKWLGGRGSVHRGSMRKPGRSSESIHTWAQYKAQDGEVYVLDVAYQFFGTLHGDRARKLFEQGKGWDYWGKGKLPTK